MIRPRAWLIDLVHAAEVGRWRLSKAIGVPGLERIRWSCLGSAGFAVLASAAAVARLFGWLPVVQLAPGQHPEMAVINFWVYVIILVISALISYALRPKPPTVQPGKAQAPLVEDGMGVYEVFGQVWVPDSIVLAWKANQPIPIRKKGGK